MSDIFAGNGYRRFEQVDDTLRHALHGLTFYEVVKARDCSPAGSLLREILTKTIATWRGA